MLGQRGPAQGVPPERKGRCRAAAPGASARPKGRQWPRRQRAGGGRGEGWSVLLQDPGICLLVCARGSELTSDQCTRHGVPLAMAGALGVSVQVSGKHAVDGGVGEAGRPTPGHPVVLQGRGRGRSALAPLPGISTPEGWASP